MTTQELLLRRTVPLIINSFNICTYVRNMVDKFRGFGFRNIIIIDNGSSYPVLMEYYKELQETGCALVLYYNNNFGPRYFHCSGIYKMLGPIPHIYSDPDCGLEFIADNFVTRLLELSVKYKCAKVGCALTLPTLDNAKKDVASNLEEANSWEKQFWQKPLEDSIYEAIIDTTFHLFNPNYYSGNENFLGTSIRVAEPGFLCYHLPVFKFDPIKKEELAYYIEQGKAWTHRTIRI